VEVLLVELNDPETSFEPLIRFFFQFHDPTTVDRQGNDSGSQYSSVIFCDDEEQKKLSNKVKNELQDLVTAGKVKYAGKKVVTGIVDSNPFYAADEDHQRYLEKNPGGYCNHRIQFKEWPAAALN
jgi:peptide-methionine (S)-S-oxide reductase